MPNIVEYNSTGTLTPSDKGIQAAEQAARVYEQTGRELAADVRHVTDKIEDHMAVMETSELYKTGTELKLNLQTRYEKESALPENRNNPHFGEQFMAEVGPLIDEWSKGAGTDHGKQLAATLGGSIRNEIFNHVAAGQSEMDAAHVQDNLTQTGNSLGSGLITDPSEVNLNRTLGTMRDTIDGMTMAIPDIGKREEVATEMRNRYLPQLVATRYQGVAESIKNQIAETGGDTSPALGQLNKDVAAQLGFQYLSPETQTRISGLGAEAVRQGQELYNSKNATAKSQMTEAGKEAYAELHNTATNFALAGQGPTPEFIVQAQKYAQIYGRTNPGEVASLDDFILRGQDRAQNNAVQPFNQQTRDTIQAGFSLPKGDPRRPTGASLLRDYSHGLITKEDMSSFTTILDKLDKPESDPSFKPAWDSFVRWRDMQVAGIGDAGPLSVEARAAFVHDATANFMGWGHAGWDKALDHVTNPHVPGNLGSPEVLKGYQRAATMGSAASGWLKNNWYHFNEDGTVSLPVARGSTAAPVYPTKASPKPTLAPAADLKKADEILWGKK